MSGNLWIILGVITAGFSLYAIPHGFQLIAKEQILRMEEIRLSAKLRTRTIQQNYDALAQVKNVFVKYKYGMSENEFYDKINNDTEFRNSLINSMIRLLGLRSELISYNFDNEFFYLIDNSLSSYYENENGKYTFNKDKTEEFILFIEKIFALTDSIEERLNEERNQLILGLTKNISENLNIKQILLDILQVRLEVLGEVKHVLTNVPASINRDQLSEKMKMESQFRENLTYRFSKLLEHRNNNQLIFYIDQNIVRLIDEKLSPIYLYNTEMNMPVFKENSINDFMDFIEKIKIIVGKVEKETVLEKERISS